MADPFAMGTVGEHRVWIFEIDARCQRTSAIAGAFSGVDLQGTQPVQAPTGASCGGRAVCVGTATPADQRGHAKRQ